MRINHPVVSGVSHLRLKLVTAAALAGLALSSEHAFPQAAGGFDAGQAVDVREGDTWSKASILKKEGRRFQVHYEGGDASTDEWVTVDRLRKPGDTSSVAAKPAAAGDDKADAPDAKKPVAAKWRMGDEIEFKDNAFWKKGKVVNTRGEWLLVQSIGWGEAREWVEPWRTRKVGDQTDDLPWTPGNGRWTPGANPPRDTPGEAPVKDARNPVRAAPPPNPFPLTSPDLSANKDLLPAAPGGAWALQPDPAPAGPPARAASLRAKTADKDLRLKSILPGQRSLVVVWGDFFGNKKIAAERVDLGSGVGPAINSFPDNMIPWAASPSGRVVVAREAGRLDAFTVQGAAPKPVHLVGFEPYAGRDDQEHDVAWAYMPTETTLLTFNTAGDLISWELAAGSAKASWTMPLGKGVVPLFVRDNYAPFAPSPGGKYLAVASREGVLMLDLKTGEIAGSVADAPTSVSSLAFSPSGKTLVTVNGGLLGSADLTTGKFGREVGTARPVNRVVCPDDGVAIGDDGSLFDLKSGGVAWKYDGAENGTIGLLGKQVYFGLDSRLGLATLPHDPAKKAVDALGDNALAVKPGTKVALDVNISGDDADKQKVVAALTAQLEKRGLVLEPGAALRIVARTEDGAPEVKRYSRHGPMRPFGETEVVTVIPKITKIWFEQTGAKLWERSAVNSMGMVISTDPNKTIQESANAMGYNLVFLQQIALPAYLAKPQEDVRIGKSQLLLGGPKDVR